MSCKFIFLWLFVEERPQIREEFVGRSHVSMWGLQNLVNGESEIFLSGAEEFLKLWSTRQGVLDCSFQIQTSRMLILLFAFV